MLLSLISNSTKTSRLYRVACLDVVLPVPDVDDHIMLGANLNMRKSVKIALASSRQCWSTETVDYLVDSSQ